MSANYGHETRKLVSNSLKQRKGGDFPCYFVNELATFSLPNDILELSPSVQEYLFEDLLDKDVQNGEFDDEIFHHPEIALKFF